LFLSFSFAGIHWRFGGLGLGTNMEERPTNSMSGCKASMKASVKATASAAVRKVSYCLGWPERRPGMGTLQTQQPA
jgi:hypothetical protein